MKTNFYLFIIILTLTNSGNRLASDYFDEHLWARNFILENRDIIGKTCNKYGNDPRTITSIIYPELLRYSIIQNWLETKTLELLYINYGTKAADFSIGIFQIKPSFVEKIEKYISSSKSLSIEYGAILFNNLSEKEKRKKRIKRLKSLNWQLIYVNCFYDIAKVNYSLAQKTSRQHIKIAATAYNYCFTCPESELNLYLKGKSFPFRNNPKYISYNYADVSWFYYKRSLFK